MNVEPVFCIWLGNRIKDEYLMNMNRTMSNLYIKNKNLKFIIYTDNVLRMNHSILTNIYELHFLKNNVIIKQIDILLQEYDKLVSISLKQYRLYFMIQEHKQEQDTLKIIKNCSDNITFLHDSFPLRNNFFEWSLIYPSFLYKLLYNNLFLARASLNLRLIALSIHNGLYLDFDIIDDKTCNLYKLQKRIEIYIKYKKIITKFLNDIKMSKLKQKINIFKKVVLKIEKLSILLKSEIDFNNIDNRIIEEYMITSNKIMLDEIKLYSFSKIETLRIREYVDGIYAISNGINSNNNGRFSQNILYVRNRSNNIKEYYISSICFGLIISMIEQDKYILNKKMNGYFITRYENKFKYDIGLPSDIFFSRKKYPFMIESKITWRNGRPLHPLGQITTRGNINLYISLQEI
jgi:hypothetical protein